MRTLLLLALLLATPAYAQILYSPTVNGAYAQLDGATVAGPISVRLKDCPAGQWTYAVDGVTKNLERSCPIDLGGDNALTTLAAGAHVITAVGSTTYTARFTVGTTPSPPPDPTVTGNAKLNWVAPIACANGEPLTECPTLGFEIEQARSAAGPWTSIHTASPTTTLYQMAGLAPGLYFWRLYTVTLQNIRSNPTAPVSFTVTAPVQTCTTPKPADEKRPGQCVAPAVGSWEQTLTYTAAAYPTCWTAGEWLPATAPAGACVTPVVWKVAPISGTRPVYEPVSNLASTAMVRGTVQGRVEPGKPCGQEVFRIGTTSYRYVDERDVTLDSPTYKGREHVAICVR